jgi:hypothetical protein
MCNNLDPSDIIIQGTGILSTFVRCDGLGASKNSKSNQLLQVREHIKVLFRHNLAVWLL